MSGSIDRASELLRSIILSKQPSTEVEKIREYLRLVRDLRLRQSDTVATYGSLLLRKANKSIPSEEYWTIMEQVAEAAMDVDSLDLAFSIVSAIRKKFPGAQRTQRITAMYLEARGKYKEAESTIGKLLEDHPNSHYAIRRQVALEKTKGNIGKAIELLRSHVDTFMTDKDAWEELAELYLKAQLYPQAAHCYEELLLHTPQSVPLHVQYADVLYTMGGGNVRTARQHYAAAVKLSNGESLRALYGICCTAAALAGQKSRQQKEDETLNRNAAEMLQRQYAAHNKAQLPLVEELLKVQGLA